MEAKKMQRADNTKEVYKYNDIIDPDNKFVIMQEYGWKDKAKGKTKRRFYSFNTYGEYEDWLELQPEYLKTCYEVIRGDHAQKLRIDADVPIKKYIREGEGKEAFTMEYLKFLMCFLMVVGDELDDIYHRNTMLDKDVCICTSHTEEKLSFHLIFPYVVLPDAVSVAALFNHIWDRFVLCPEIAKSRFIETIDKSIYNDNNKLMMFRLVDNHKFGKVNIKLKRAWGNVTWTNEDTLISWNVVHPIPFVSHIVSIYKSKKPTRSLQCDIPAKANKELALAFEALVEMAHSGGVDYERNSNWYPLMCAINTEFKGGEEGLNLLNDLSRKYCPKEYDVGEIVYRYSTLDCNHPRGYTIATIMRHAKDANPNEYRKWKAIQDTQRLRNNYKLVEGFYQSDLEKAIEEAPVFTYKKQATKWLLEEVTKVVAYIRTSDSYVYKISSTENNMSNKNMLAHYKLKYDGGEIGVGKLMDGFKSVFSYDKIVCNPYHPWIGDNTSSEQFNNYIPPDVVRPERVDKSLIKPILDHIKALTGTDYKFFINWLRRVLQKPWQKTGQCVVMISDEGAGKSSIVEFLYEYVLGHHLVIPNISLKDATDKFNSQQMGKLLININEIPTLDGGTYKMFIDLLSMITDPMCKYEKKFMDMIMFRSIANYIVTTNSFTSVRVAPGDRRYAIMACSDKFRGNLEYFRELRKSFTPEVGAHFYEYLLTTPIKTKYEKIPDSAARQNCKLHALKTEQEFIVAVAAGLKQECAWVIDKIQIYGGKRAIPANDFYDMFVAWNKCGSSKTITKFGSEIYGFIGKSDKRMLLSSGKRCYVYYVDEIKDEYKLLAELKEPSLTPFINTTDNIVKKVVSTAVTIKKLVTDPVSTIQKLSWTPINALITRRQIAQVGKYQGYIYIVSRPQYARLNTQIEGVYKIGKTVDPQRRLKEYGSGAVMHYFTPKEDHHQSEKILIANLKKDSRITFLPNEGRESFKGSLHIITEHVHRC